MEHCNALPAWAYTFTHVIGYYICGNAANGWVGRSYATQILKKLCNGR